MSTAGQYQILSGVVIEMTNDGWAEFKKWIDGTYASLKYTWVGDGSKYHILAVDDQITRLCVLDYGDATDFVNNFKNNNPVQPPRDDTGHPIYKLDAPSESDGKPNFVPVPFTQGLYMFISTRGDDLDGETIKRGEGTKLILSWDGSTGDAEREVTTTFHETVELHDGHVDFDPALWGFDDEWSIFIRIPASTVTPNGTNEGNCNLFVAQQFTPWDSGTSYSQGDLVTHSYVNWVCIQAHSNQEPPNAAYWQPMVNVILPAAGDGAFDLVSPVVVPYEGAGYWGYSVWDDELTPVGPGADWMLFDFPMDDVYMVKNLSCSSHMGFWELDAYKVEPLYPRWQLGFKCNRVDHTSRDPAVIGGHFTCFRKSTT